MTVGSQPWGVLVPGGKWEASDLRLKAPQSHRKKTGGEGEGRQVVRSHGREALFDYGEEFEFYYKFPKKSLESFKQKSDVE